MTWWDKIPCPPDIGTVNTFTGEEVAVEIPILSSCAVRRRVEVTHDFESKDAWETYYQACPKTVCSDWKFPDKK